MAEALPRVVPDSNCGITNQFAINTLTNCGIRQSVVNVVSSSKLETLSTAFRASASEQPLKRMDSAMHSPPPADC